MEFPRFGLRPASATNKRESPGGAEPINKAYRQLYDRGTRCPNNQPPWWCPCQPLLFQGAYQSLEMQTTGITTNDRANRAHTPTSSKVDGGMDRFYGPLEIRLTADGTRFWRREGVRLPLFDEEHSLLEGLFPKVDKGVL